MGSHSQGKCDLVGNHSHSKDILKDIRLHALEIDYTTVGLVKNHLHEKDNLQGI